MKLIRQRLDGAKSGGADVMFHAFHIVIDDLVVQAKEFKKIGEQLMAASDVQRQIFAGGR